VAGFFAKLVAGAIITAILIVTGLIWLALILAGCWVIYIAITYFWDMYSQNRGDDGKR
jgi:hypothetical protein